MPTPQILVSIACYYLGACEPRILLRASTSQVLPREQTSVDTRACSQPHQARLLATRENHGPDMVKVVLCFGGLCCTPLARGRTQDGFSGTADPELSPSCPHYFDLVWSLHSSSCFFLLLAPLCLESGLTGVLVPDCGVGQGYRTLSQPHVCPPWL